MIKFYSQIFTINDIYGWYRQKELVLSPAFQRREVWKLRGKSFLIDSILRGVPIPQFFIRQIVLPREMRTVREVVDGQQRLTSIFGYIQGDFTVLPMHKNKYSRIIYNELPEDVQQEFLSYPLSVNRLEGTSDADVIEIFRRINSYSAPLNAQELLNAQYVGAFSQSIAELARTHFVYWERHQILSTNNIARMLDVQLTSELVAAMLLGIQEKKIIAQLYEKYDEGFPEYEYLKPQYGITLQLCEDLLSGNIAATIFRRAPIFYSLFCAIYDSAFGFGSGADAIARPMNSTGAALAQDRLIAASEMVDELKEGVRKGIDDEERKAGFGTFYEDTKASTDKLLQRQRRHEFLKQTIAPAFEGF